MTADRIRFLADNNDASLGLEFAAYVQRTLALAEHLGQTALLRPLEMAWLPDLTAPANFDLVGQLIAIVNQILRSLLESADRGLSMPTEFGMTRFAENTVEEIEDVLFWSKGFSSNLVAVLRGSANFGVFRHNLMTVAQRIDSLYETNPRIHRLGLCSMVASISYVLVGAPYSSIPTPGNDDLVGLVDLEVNGTPTSESIAGFTSRLEVLVHEVDAALERGLFDNDDQKRRQVERDLNYVRAEAYETDPAEFLGESLGAIVARLARSLVSVTQIPDAIASVVDASLNLMGSDQPGRVPEVVEAVLHQSSLDDPVWLASQDESVSMAIQEEGPDRWFAGLLGWIKSENFGPDAGIVRNVGAVGVMVGGGIGLVVSAFLNNVGAVSAAASATIGGVIGVFLGWVAVRYRNRS